MHLHDSMANGIAKKELSIIHGIDILLGEPNITWNLYCIWLNEHETCSYADAVQICGNIWNV